MKDKRRKKDRLPEEFDTPEEAAEFWESHDTADYPGAFEDVKVEARLDKRHFEVEVDEDVVRLLQARAEELGIPIRDLASTILREKLKPAA